MPDIRVLLSTCPPDAAEDIASGLLERHLAACVNVIAGVASRYHWKGRLERDEESLLVIKTTRECVPAIIAALDELHPYDVPELLSLPVEEGADAYVRWVRESTASPDAS